MVQHGAYRLLLDHYYASSEPLPSNKEQLYRICRAFNKDEREAVDFIVNCFFVLENNSYINKRCNEELSKKVDISNKRKRAVEQREKNRLSSDTSHDTSNDDTSTSTSTSTITVTTKEEDFIGDKPPKPEKVVGSRFENWVKTQDIEKVKSEWVDWALNNSSLHETEITRQLENFSDYWIATTGSKATKADWTATWRTWIRNNYNKGYNNGNNRTNKTKQDILDWVDGR
jgi:uncharacterized protein YdaU (DUF1376 family)